MNVYIAAPWKDRVTMPDVAAQLENAGHTITHKWWLTENGGDVPVRGDDRTTFMSEMANQDFDGVMSADIVVLINSCKSEGKSVEQGIALAFDKDIIAVGKRGEFSNNVFHYMDNYIWVDSVEEAIKELDNVS